MIKTGNIVILKDTISDLKIVRGCHGKVIKVTTFPKLAYDVELHYNREIITLQPHQIVKWDPQKKQFKLFDSVKLLVDIPEEGLSRGMSGAIVEIFFTPDLGYEVEVFNVDGSTAALATLKPDQLEIFHEKNTACE